MTGEAKNEEGKRDTFERKRTLSNAAFSAPRRSVQSTTSVNLSSRRENRKVKLEPLQGVVTEDDADEI